MRKNLVVLFVVFSLTLCSCARNNTAVMVNINLLLADLIGSYTAAAEGVLGQPNVPEEDKKRLRNIHMRSMILLERFEQVGQGYYFSNKDLYALFMQAKTLYIEARVILVKYYNDFPETDQEILVRFDYNATWLDNQVAQAQANSEFSQEALENVQTFVLNVLTMLVPLIL